MEPLFLDLTSSLIIQLLLQSASKSVFAACWLATHNKILMVRMRTYCCIHWWKISLLSEPNEFFNRLSSSAGAANTNTASKCTCMLRPPLPDGTLTPAELLSLLFTLKMHFFMSMWNCMIILLSFFLCSRCSKRTLQAKSYVLCLVPERQGWEWVSLGQYT